MQAHQHGGSGNANNSHTGGGGGNDHHPQQQQQQMSFDGLDMQRFQQQLQAAQQYRQQQQQQQHYGGVVGAAGTSAAVGGMSMMQQQQHLGMNNPSAMTGMIPAGMGQHTNHNMPPQQASLHGMNHSNSNSMMGGMPQFTGGNTNNNNNNNNNSNNSNAFGGNWNNPAATSQQGYNVAPTDVYNNFDASSGRGNQRLMTMSGLGGGGGGKSNNNNNNHPYGAAAGSMMGQHVNNDPNVNSVLVNTENSSTALQNMQLMLLKQQQQQQGLGNRTAMHPEQRPSMLSGIPTTFNASHQFSKSASPITASTNTMGAPGGGNSSQQQMLLFQQQLSALQKQQQMSGVGGTATANAAMVAMQQGNLQPLGVDGNNSLYGQSLPNSATALSSNLQQGALQQQSQLLQARQQQIAQQMQQQHLNRSVSDNVNIMDGSGNTSFNIPAKQQAGSMLRNVSSASTGMFNMMNQPSMHQHGSVMDPMQLQPGSAMSMLNANNFPQPSGMIGNQNNTSNVTSSSNHRDPLSSIGQVPALNDQNADQSQSSDQTPFLDGRFAGGWQSNADLPERRHVIFCILDVIRQMRPDTSRLSSKLPHMAKSLEEHLYRSAKSKEEYMDVSTLKTRLQAIAHGLEVHRSTDSTMPLNSMNPLDTSLGAINATGDQNWSVATALRSGMGEMSGLSGLLAQSNPGPPSSSSHLNPNNLPKQSVHQNSGTMGSYQGMNVQQQGNTLPFRQGVPSTNQVNSQSVGLDKEQGVAYQPQGSSTRGSSPSTAFLNELDGNQDVDLFSIHSNVGGRDGTQQNSSTDSWAQGNNSVPSSTLQSKNMDFAMASKFEDPTDAQKMRVILQQQQRLLLLRHASKCTAGPQCTTKFCEQMVTLWKHMKTCRNKNCKTSHCLSSRCVLNHYRVCKSNGRTLMCEVCGPVMVKIKQQERDDGTNDDPLTRDQEMMPGEQQSASVGQVPSGPHPVNDQSQLHMVQAVQTKLKAQLDILKLLQKHQEQLLEQQKRLESQAQNISDSNSPEFLQLQEQQVLLQQLQKRCQQQQLLIQHEIQMPTSSSNNETNHQYLSMANNEPALTSSSDIKYSGDVKASVNKNSDSVSKRSGKSLVFPPSRKSKTKNVESQSSTAASASDRLAKKAKVTPKPKGILSTSHIKPEKESRQKRLEEDPRSQLSCMSSDEIRKHLDSLNKRIVLSSRTVTHKCRPILQELMDDQFGWVFHDAVDPVALGLPDYFDVIKNPMHMDLIRKKLENAIYPDMDSFAHDMRLVFQNSILYNGESSEVGELAQSMMSRFEKLFSAVQADIEHSHLNLESQGELCSLCGLQKKRYEPTVLYCQGKCGMQRIKRNDPYYTDRTKQNHWCEPCFNLLDPNKNVLLDDGSEVAKQELQDFKNDALPEEGWVNCDSCHSWVHQVCALFNGRTNKSNARFTCPNCCISSPSTEESRDKAKKAVKSADDLPRCKMSDALEKGLYDSLHAAYTSRSVELGVAFEDIEKANGLCVRVLSNVEKKNLVGEKMRQRYAFQNYPNEFPLRSKCIALFQKIHGVDTLLFAMYVYEYGDDCPAPNRRHVYISYLDSVRYFEPKCFRTTAYHAVIVEYLRYVKKRGFHTASIWSCPPVNGDDYIFYCHPKHQLVPREDMLRAWYHKMLDQAKAQGIVLSTSTLYDEYFASESESKVASKQLLTPTCLPYFEGDYIPGELEIIIQQSEANGDKVSDSSSHDTVMVRLGHNLLKMKDNFIVVHLRNKRFVDAVQRGEDVSHWKEDSDDDMVRSKRAKISAKLSPESDLGMKQANSSVNPMTAIDVFASNSEIIPIETKLGTSNPTEKSININASGNDQATNVIVDGEKKMVSKSELHCGEDINQSSTSSQEVGSTKDTNEREIDDRETEDGGISTEFPASDPAVVPKLTSDEPLIAEKSLLSIKASDDETLVNPDNDAVSNEVSPLNPQKSVDDVTNSNLETLSGNAISDQVDILTSTGDNHVIVELQDDDVNNLGSTVGEVSVGTMVGTAKLVVTEKSDAPSSEEKLTKNASSTTEESLGNDMLVSETSQVTATQHSPNIDQNSPAHDNHNDNSIESQTDDEPTKKRPLDDLIPIIESHVSSVRSCIEKVSDTSDDDPPMESEMFESRQQFLNYCQSAHCQFDELRRAKHSTVMVLFQLHNPSAPKFLQQCGACYRDITHGIRHHCKDCSNFDLCEDCYEPIIAGTWAKRDPRFAHDEHHTFTAIDMESTDNTPKSQADRQNSLKAHVKLLEHAAFCSGPPTCSLHNCDRFKKIFLHVSGCEIKPKRDCKICTRLLVLCTMHSRLCNSRDPCPVPFCDRIRERNKRLYRQQQLMDDRRRQAQNELYHAGGEN